MLVKLTRLSYWEVWSLPLEVVVAIMDASRESEGREVSGGRLHQVVKPVPMESGGVYPPGMSQFLSMFG